MYACNPSLGLVSPLHLSLRIPSLSLSLTLTRTVDLRTLTLAQSPLGQGLGVVGV
jgi:hypothetical protein